MGVSEVRKKVWSSAEENMRRKVCEERSGPLVVLDNFR